MFFVNLILGLLAYRALLGIGVSRPPQSMDLEAAVDSFFFVPTDMAPGVAVGICAWLLYRRRVRIFSVPRQRGSMLGVAALLGMGLAVFAWATLSGVPDLLALSLLFNLLGFALLLGAAPGLRAVALPAFTLLFALPIPAPLLNEIVYHFQIWTADYAGWILFKLGVPGFVSGDQIIQHGKRFVVIESCSGLRSVETLTLLAILLIDLFRRRGLHAVLIVAAAPLVAFALNGFRVVGLILNPHSRIAAIHILQGIVILLGGLVILYMLDGLLARFLRSKPLRRLPRLASAPAGTMGGRVIAAVLAACFVASWLLPSWVPSGNATPPLTSRTVEDRLEGWVSTPLDQKQLRFFFGSAGLRQSLHRRYRTGTDQDDQVEVFVGFGMHSNRSRSPISPKTAYPGSGWAVEREERVEIEPGGPPVLARVLRSGTERVLIYHWYESSGDLWNETVRSFLSLDRTPWRRDQDALAVRMSTKLDGPNEEHRARGEARLTRFFGVLAAALQPLGAESI